jgi:hypothetical protein
MVTVVVAVPRYVWVMVVVGVGTSISMVIVLSPVPVALLKVVARVVLPVYVLVVKMITSPADPGFTSFAGAVDQVAVAVSSLVVP